MKVLFHIKSSKGFSASLQKHYEDKETFYEEHQDDLEEWAYKEVTFNGIAHARYWVEILEE